MCVRSYDYPRDHGFMHWRWCFLVKRCNLNNIPSRDWLTVAIVDNIISFLCSVCMYSICAVCVSYTALWDVIERNRFRRSDNFLLKWFLLDAQKKERTTSNFLTFFIRNWTAIIINLKKNLRTNEHTLLMWIKKKGYNNNNILGSSASITWNWSQTSFCLTSHITKLIKGSAIHKELF